ncbi:hypothetical protein BDR07DRAFT_1431654 [Suillus spraguei]|nr:hypothetical protein BDR07DRAFT_1431654 [Suillus spraguei]
MVISEVASEDPRFPKKDAPPLSEEFPDGTNIFFLGEHAALSVVLAFFLSDKMENNKFKIIVDSRVSQHYLPSFKAASTIRMSLRALSKITSSFMAKGLKIIDYSRKVVRRLIHEYKVGPESSRFWTKGAMVSCWICPTIPSSHLQDDIYSSHYGHL